MPKFYTKNGAAEEILRRTRAQAAASAAPPAPTRPAAPFRGGLLDALNLIGRGQTLTAEAQMAPARSFVYDGAESNRGPYKSGAPIAPPGESVEANIAEARRHRGDFLGGVPWWLNKVWFKHDWDYKKQNPKFEDFGNYNYGATGTALGIPDGVVLRGAGAAQMYSDLLHGKVRPQQGVPVGPSPYGDEPKDQTLIVNGIFRGRR